MLQDRRGLLTVFNCDWGGTKRGVILLLPFLILSCLPFHSQKKVEVIDLSNNTVTTTWHNIYPAADLKPELYNWKKEKNYPLELRQQWHLAAYIDGFYRLNDTGFINMLFPRPEPGVEFSLVKRAKIKHEKGINISYTFAFDSDFDVSAVDIGELKELFSISSNSGKVSVDQERITFETPFNEYDSLKAATFASLYDSQGTFINKGVPAFVTKVVDGSVYQQKKSINIAITVFVTVVVLLIVRNSISKKRFKENSISAFSHLSVKLAVSGFILSEISNYRFF